MRFVEDAGFDEIHFFGDKTYEVRGLDSRAVFGSRTDVLAHQGGNDYEIFESDKTIGHTVASPEDTLRICKDLWLS